MANICIFIVALLMWGINEAYAQPPNKSFNVMDFGALGDGIKDDSLAFSQAWNATCQDKSPNVILQIPKEKTFMLKPIKFNGPCNSPNINIQVAGQMVAPNELSDYPKPTPYSWLIISGVDGLTVNGGGTFNGQGQTWWNICNGRICPERPATIAFVKSNNITLEDLRFLNSAGNHITITSCSSVKISLLSIKAPEDSPNTDGIDISFSSAVSIRNSLIATGDDCIAISNQSNDINVTSVTCGPGHGISIGSLGREGRTGTVENIYVANCTFKDTQNGARIKTWQGGSGYARNITFENILFRNASNPIIIDQFYCADPGMKCKNQTEAVKISDITFRNVFGTTTSKAGIVLHCSESLGCTNIIMEKVNISSSIPGRSSSADCLNAHCLTTDFVLPALNCPK